MPSQGRSNKLITGLCLCYIVCIYTFILALISKDSVINSSASSQYLDRQLRIRLSNANSKDFLGAKQWSWKTGKCLQEVKDVLMDWMNWTRQQKLVHFITDKGTQEATDTGFSVLNPVLSNGSLRQWWAPVHLAPANRPGCQGLQGGPGPITGASQLIQLIPPPPSCLVHVCFFSTSKGEGGNLAVQLPSFVAIFWEYPAP